MKKSIIALLITLLIAVNIVNPLNVYAHDPGLLNGVLFDYGGSYKTVLTNDSHGSTLNTNVYSVMESESLGGIQANKVYVDIYSIDYDGNGTPGIARIKLIDNLGNELYRCEFDSDGEHYIDIGSTITNIDKVVFESVIVAEKISIDEIDLYYEETDTTPPGEVTGLTADVLDYDVTLTWTNPSDTDFDSVNIYRDDVLIAGNVTGTTYTDAGLAVGDYTYKVTTLDTTGNESVGQTVTASVVEPADTTPPGEVTGLTADVLDYDVTLNWTNPSDTDFDSVNIYRDDVLIAGNVTGTTYTDAGLAVGDYTYKVTTLDTTGNESVGQTITASVVEPADTIPPGEVTGLTADVLDYDVTLTWTNPSDTDFDSVNIYRDDVLVAGNVTGTTYTDIGLAVGDYTYKVTTLDTKGNESAGQTITASVVALSADEITNINYTVTTSSVSFTWDNPVENFQRVDIYRDDIKIGESTTGQYEDTGLQPNTQYIYKFVSVSTDNVESQGVQVTITTSEDVDIIPPSAPTGLTVTTGSRRGYLEWTPNTDTDLAGYNVYIDGVKYNTSLVTSTYYQVSGLENGQEYQVYVTAVDSSGNESDPSSVEFFTPDGIDIPILSLSFNLADVVDSISNWFMQIWPMIAFAVGIPLSFYVMYRIKELFV